MNEVPNVMLPMRLGSLGRRERTRRADFFLDTLGIAHCANRTPELMSGGQRQRAAIARALPNQPSVLLADEPTGEHSRAAVHAREYAVLDRAGRISSLAT